jgi:hypothetical protein
MSVVKDVEIMRQGVVFKFRVKLTIKELPRPPPDQSIDELLIVTSSHQAFFLEETLVRTSKSSLLCQKLMP